MLTRLFVEVPLLLRDYLAQCSAEFLSGRSETYGQLVSRLLQSRHDVAFISLNYDTLLEQAVSAFTQRRFAGLDDYVNRAPLVLKPHGSVNWSWLFPRPSNDNVPRFLDRLAGLPIVDGGRTKGASLSVYSDSERSDPRPAYTWFEGEQLRVHVQNDTGRDPVWAYPAVTAPLAGKSARDLVPPSGHFQALARFQRECHRYLFIGTAA